MNNRAIFLALGAAVCWAFAEVLSKAGLARMDFFAYGCVRPLLALPFIASYGLITSGFSFPDSRLIGIAVLGGFLDSFLGTFLYMLALERNPAYQVAPLSSTAPFWGVVVAVLFLGERPHPVVFISAVLVVLGAYFLSGRRRGTTGGSGLGAVAALGAGCMWGVAETLPAKYCLAQGMVPIAYQLVLVCAAALSWGVMAIWKRHRLRWSAAGLGIASLSAFTGFFLGWVFWLSGLSRAPASVLSPVRGSTTIFSFLFSVVILHERPSTWSAVGVVLVFVGVLLASTLGTAVIP